ncbi:MAG: DNRLRE domain-containing protein [Actinomycetota bacterium]
MSLPRPASPHSLPRPTLSSSRARRKPNRGLTNELRIRNATKEAYLRFDLTGIGADDNVTKATLKLYATNASGCSLGGEVLRAANDTWVESTITWNNRPGAATGANLGTVTSWPANAYVSWDVTAAVVGGEKVSFVVRMPPSCNVRKDSVFRSREAAKKPQLVVETDAQPTPSPTVSETPVPSPSGAPTPTPTPTESVPPPGAGTVIAAAGDIACKSGDSTNPCQQTATANLITSDPSIGHVLALGDNQYENGSLAEYLAGYDKSWGAFKAKTKPSVGNHEYVTMNAQGYRDYFGTGSGPLYYSFDVGDWHVVAIDSNCKRLPTGGTAHGCAKGSPQEVWLRNDLAADDSACTLAFWHHPRFSSDAPLTQIVPLFTDLYDDGAELVLSGHAHSYERFAPQTPAGTIDENNGVVQFVVGTGGKNHRPFDLTPQNSIVRNDTAFGILRLTLDASGYIWEFVSTDGSFSDSGAAACHDPPSSTVASGAPAGTVPVEGSPVLVSTRVYRNENGVAKRLYRRPRP